MLTSKDEWKSTKWKAEYCEGDFGLDFAVGDEVEVTHQSGVLFKVRFKSSKIAPFTEKYEYERKSGALVRTKPIWPNGGVAGYLVFVMHRVGETVHSVRFELGNPTPDTTGVWGGGGA